MKKIYLFVILCSGLKFGFSQAPDSQGKLNQTQNVGGKKTVEVQAQTSKAQSQTTQQNPFGLEEGSPQYENQKKAWIENNHRAYENLNNSGYQHPSQSSNAEGQSTTALEQAHIKEKNEWIKNNAEAYRSSGGNPDAVLNPSDPNTAFLEKTAEPNLSAFEAIETFQLIKAEAVPTPESKATPKELEAETQNIQKDFPAQSIKFQVGKGGAIRLFGNGKMDLRGIETREGKKVNWYFENKECETCSKTLSLILMEESAGKKIYVMQSEDGSTTFAYRLTFTTITHK